MPPQQTQIQPIPPDLVAALIKHGDQALGLGDISAARLWYQRAAEAGSARAAIALGKTYDPNYAAPGNAPDTAKAAALYRKAIAMGDPRAAELLNKMGLH
jgi:TPR repeat protein